MIYGRTVKLLGAYPATIKWRDDTEDGEILVDSEFVATASEYTRRSARTQAGQFAPHVTNWVFVPRPGFIKPPRQ